MSNIPIALSRRQPGRLAAIGRRAARLAKRFGLALQVRAERRFLMRLDHAALKDMGFNKGQAENEANRPFWDIPVDRLR